MLKATKAPERSNFAQTCNLLSQYVKEKGMTGDFSLGMTRKLESKEKPETSPPVATTMDLLTNMANSAAEALRQNTGTPSKAQSTDFLQQFGCFDPSNSSDVASNKPDFRKSAIKEAATAQMTIFYAGQVLVFNDFPADKARAIMALGRKGSSYISGIDKVNSGSFIAPAASNIAATSQRNPTQDIGSDLPIVRRASLHRFLEKRKDRVAAKAPYQVNPPSQAPPKPKESNPWIDLEGQSSKLLELKL
ncbi:protein TIFY 10A-like isoform X2 [Corylus avellana]|uniref:protein TIFY 10A-like isoform X2 n=1 Tax=Corylus avellana TaxID=13451 RepID=UPI001E2079AF|nr:protein TIFY 10A-like isoform X2 [Corylus avellana]